MFDDVVVPISNSNPYIGGSSLGAPPPTGGVGGYQLSDFGFDLYDWDQLHYRESTSDNLSGTYTAGNAASYAVTQKSTATYSWDSTRLFTSNGEGTGDGTAVYTDEYSNTWMYYLSISDAAGNFASNTQYDANGYPTDLFVTPASGTTFLARTFDSGSSNGFTDTTCSVVNGEDDDVSSAVWSTGSSGITGSFYTYNNTATVNGSSSGNSDTVSWNVSQQSTGSYGGSDSGSLSIDANNALNGTTTTSGNSSGQSSSSAALTDTYQRGDGDSGLDGTLQISSSGTQNYSGQSTEKQTYTADNLTADTVQYSNSGGGNGSVTASNSDSYTTTSVLGSGEGTDFAFSNSWNQGLSMARGTNDLVAKTGSGSALSIASSGGTSIAFSTGSYDADVDSLSTSATSFLATTGNAFSTSAIAGKFKADGTQTSGTYYSFNMGSGGYGGFTTSQYTEADYPSSTSTQTVNGSSSGDATTNLRANSDGSANGSMGSHDSSSATTDTTTTLVGTKQLSNGTAVYNNKSHSNDVQSGTDGDSLQVQAGVVNGTATAELHDNNSWDYDLSVTVDINNKVLHAEATGEGDGSTKIDDTGKGTIAAGKPARQTETIVFTQTGDTDSEVNASGALKDAAGHTGKWTQESSAEGGVDDKVTINLTDGQEIRRVFHIDESSDSDMTFDESDKGLNLPPSTATSIYRGSHTLHVTSYSDSSTYRDGTANNYTFEEEQHSGQTMNEERNTVIMNLATGDGSTTQFSSSSGSTAWNEISGTKIDNVPSQSTKLSVGKSTFQKSQTDSHNYSPTTINDGHSRMDNYFDEWRKGTIASGMYERITSGSTAMWGETTTKEGITPWGNAKPTLFGPESVVRFWPSPGVSIIGNSELLWAAFEGNPIAQWVSTYGGAALQIAFGVLDVISGAAMTLGTCGGAVIPGLGLMAVGVDQIIAGAYNVSNPGTPSFFQYWGSQTALALGASNNMAQLVGEYTPAALSAMFGVWGGLLRACFAAGTPLLTPEGSESIENIEAGDYVLARDEFDPDGPVLAKQVEEVFRNYAPIWHVHVGEQVIRTTGEHPFWVRGKGWKSANELEVGDELSSHDGQWVTVEDLLDTGECETVYNLRVAEFHTYFVGRSVWGFSVWAHNNCLVTNKSISGKSPSKLRSMRPSNWTELPAARGHGWVLVDETGVERLRYMYPNKNGLFVHELTGYFRRMNEAGQFLDISGNVVDELDSMFNVLTHIIPGG